jgi:hypothetical protein
MSGYNRLGVQRQVTLGTFYQLCLRMYLYITSQPLA